MSERVLTVEDCASTCRCRRARCMRCRACRSMSIAARRCASSASSGCGKTLTALAIMDLLPARAQRTAARLELEGQSLAGVGERAMADIRGNRMAMIFQEPMTSLNPAYTIGNQLEEALLRHRRVARRQARERARLSARSRRHHRGGRAA